MAANHIVAIRNPIANKARSIGLNAVFWPANNTHHGMGVSAILIKPGSCPLPPLMSVMLITCNLITV